MTSGTVRLAQAEKERRLITKRRRGMTWADIADTEGYASPAGAYRAWRNAIAKIPAPDINAIRAESETLYEYQYAKLIDTIENPPPITSAAGKVVTDDAGNPIPDKSARTRAQTELRHLDESRRRLHAADKPAQIPKDEAMRRVTEYLNNLPPAELVREYQRTVAGEIEPAEPRGEWNPWDSNRRPAGELP